jgi:hypothetical protein
MIITEAVVTESPVRAAARAMAEAAVAAEEGYTVLQLQEMVGEQVALLKNTGADGDLCAEAKALIASKFFDGYETWITDQKLVLLTTASEGADGKDFGGFMLGRGYKKESDGDFVKSFPTGTVMANLYGGNSTVEATFKGSPGKAAIAERASAAGIKPV